MAEIKKVVIKVGIHDDKDKKKALQAVTCVSGIDNLAIEMKDQKLTITGNMDPLRVVKKLKKWHTEILTLEPAKEPEKKPEENKAEAGEKKENEDAEKNQQQQKEEEEAAIRRFIEAQRVYNPCMCMNQRYYLHPVEEDPWGCVIV